MLVLTRKRDESIRIGSEIVIRVVRLSRGKVRIGIEAPADVPIHRAELPAQAVPPARNAPDVS